MPGDNLISRISARAVARRRFLRGAAGLTAAGSALYLLGCGSSDDDDDAGATPQATAAATQAPEGGIQPRILTSELVVREPNRFAIGLLGPDGQLVKDAEVYLKFFKIGADGQTGTLRAEGAADFRQLTMEGAHAHDESTGDLASVDELSFYAVTAPFEEAGPWGVQVDVTPQDGDVVSRQLRFEVAEQSTTPGIGTRPPASQNDTAATNPNTASLCSRDPACSLHDKVIADVLGAGRPLVVQFSTPAYCTTRFCGPVLEVLLSQVPAYSDRIDFVHIEVFRDFQLQQYREAALEWNLPGEPYTFFVAGDGTVRGRLESVFANEELVAKLDSLVAA